MGDSVHALIHAAKSGESFQYQVNWDWRGVAKDRGWAACTQGREADWLLLYSISWLGYNFSSVKRTSELLYQNS